MNLLGNFQQILIDIAAVQVNFKKGTTIFLILNKHWIGYSIHLFF